MSTKIEVDQETMDAHKASEAMWEERVKEEGWDSMKECAYCVLGRKKKYASGDGGNTCKDCPIMADTGKYECYGTPFRDARANPTAENKGRELDYLRALGKRLVLKKERITVGGMPLGQPFTLMGIDDDVVYIRVKKDSVWEKGMNSTNYTPLIPVNADGDRRWGLCYASKHSTAYPLDIEAAGKLGFDWKAVL
ncbi:MAG: hypothetical protein JRL30_00835 [Deltaproteobacteria bacterium]|nr:hypothetical protein [Deltaproteobacteria bacterium]